MRQLLLPLLLTAACSAASAQIAEKAVREKVAGIDVVAYRTDVKDVVTLRGSLPAGDCFAPKENMAIPTLVGEMLDKGTTKQNKFEIAQKLEQIGARIAFSVDGVMTEFEGKCLRKDLPLVISVLAEELRAPAFTEEEFAKLKKQFIGDLQRALESPDFRADQAFAEAVFPPGHPNYSAPTTKFIEAIQGATLEDVRKFYSEFYGPAQATIVAVGDIDVAVLKDEIGKAFAGWSGGKTVPEFPKAVAPNERKEQTISMADKPSVSVMVGQASGLRYRDPDALALRVGTAVLGHGFTGRLMANIRDREGLTYGIGASVSDDAFADGEWRISGDFAPQLLEQGMASTQRELENWQAKGITAAELERVKSMMIGSFKVGLTTTEGMSTALLNAVHRGYDVTWLDEYPKRISAMSLEQVNAAIKKHLQPQKMTVTKAGSVPPPQDRG